MAPSSKYHSNLGQIIEYIPGTLQAKSRFLAGLACLLCCAMEGPCCQELKTRLPWSLIWAPRLRFRHPVTWLTIADRLYLAAYLETPDENTLFPYPEPPPRSPTKRSQRAIDGPSPAQSTRSYMKPYYFTVDDTLLYNAFHHDFGPLHIGHLYRFALQFHEILGAKENKDRPVVFWSRADPRSMFITHILRPCVAASTNASHCLRPCECLVLVSLLHGSDPIMAAPSGSCANGAGGPPTDALPGCWL